jgi:outer membrane cobalamin receptor
MKFSHKRIIWNVALIRSLCFCSLITCRQADSKPNEKVIEKLKEQQESIPQNQVNGHDETTHAIDVDQVNDAALSVTVRKNTSQTTPITYSSTNLQTLLKSSGAWSLATGGEGSRLELQLRGSSGAQTGIYLDQIPLHSLRGQSVDLNLFAIDLFEQVRVKHGGDGALKGSGVMSGYIQLMPKRNQDKVHLKQLKFSTSTQGFAQISTLYQKQISTQSNGLFALSLGGGPNQFPYQDQYSTHKRRSYSDFTRLTGLGHIDYSLGDWQLSLLGGWGLLDRGEPGPEAFSLPNRRSHQRATFFSTSITSPSTPLGVGLISLTLNTSLLGLTYHFNEENPLWQSQDNAQTEFEDKRYQTQAEVIFEYNHWLSSLIIELSQTYASVLKTRVQRTQGALIPNFHWTIKPWVSWRFAYRLDFNTERSFQMLPSTTLMLNTLDLRPWRWWISWSKVWRDPGFDERYLVGPSILPNPSLQPEDGQWAEMGISKSIKSLLRYAPLRIHLSLKGFAQRFEQLIIYVPIDPYRLRADNILGADYLGLEGKLILSYQPKYWKFTLDSRATKLEHKLRMLPRGPLPLRPNLFGISRISMRRKVSDGHLEGWLQSTYRGSVTVDIFGERRLAPRHILAIGLNRSWQQKQRYILAVRIDNLTNQNSYDFALHPIPGRSIWCSFGISDI